MASKGLVIGCVQNTMRAHQSLFSLFFLRAFASVTPDPEMPLTAFDTNTGSLNERLASNDQRAAECKLAQGILDRMIEHERRCSLYLEEVCAKYVKSASGIALIWLSAAWRSQ